MFRLTFRTAFANLRSRRLSSILLGIIIAGGAMSLALAAGLRATASHPYQQAADATNSVDVHVRAFDRRTDISSVARQPGAVREHMGNRGLGHARMQAADILADGIVEAELALLAQLHNAGRGKALRVRGNAEAVARSELLASVEIGKPKCMLGDDLAAMDECDHDAGLLDGRLLEFDPGADVVDRGSQPRVHCAPIARG